MKRFWDKTRKTDTCWLWTGSVNRLGYGEFKLGGKVRVAHRVAFELSNGSIPEGLDVLHKCDVRSCVNPNHLYAGTQQQNMTDMCARGRQWDRHGARHPNTRLTVDDVRSIRVDSRTHGQIARDFSLDRSTVSKIKSGKNWGSVAA